MRHPRRAVDGTSDNGLQNKYTNKLPCTRLNNYYILLERDRRKTLQRRNLKRLQHSKVTTSLFEPATTELRTQSMHTPMSLSLL